MSLYHHLHIPVDCIVIGATTLATAVSTIILADGANEVQELRLLLLPLLGAVIISGGMVMLNPTPETRRITIGRSIFALFFGALSPSMIAAIHPALADIGLRPVALLIVGGVISALVFVLSKPFTRQMYERAESVAKREVERLEAKYSPAMESKTVTVTETKPATYEQDRTDSGNP